MVVWLGYSLPFCVSLPFVLKPTAPPDTRVEKRQAKISLFRLNPSRSNILLCRALGDVSRTPDAVGCHSQRNRRKRGRRNATRGKKQLTLEGP